MPKIQKSGPENVFKPVRQSNPCRHHWEVWGEEDKESRAVNRYLEHNLLDACTLASW